MKYKVSNHRTGEHLGKMPELDYTRLEALLKDVFEAKEVIFAQYDPLPGTVSVRIITQANVTIYEKIEVDERDLKNEAMELILDSVPFDWDDIVDVDSLGYIEDNEGKKHFCIWGLARDQARDQEQEPRRHLPESESNCKLPNH
jgi:hypothetical protein